MPNNPMELILTSGQNKRRRSFLNRLMSIVSRRKCLILCLLFADHVEQIRFRVLLGHHVLARQDSFMQLPGLLNVSLVPMEQHQPNLLLNVHHVNNQRLGHQRPRVYAHAQKEASLMSSSLVKREP